VFCEWPNLLNYYYFLNILVDRCFFPKLTGFLILLASWLQFSYTNQVCRYLFCFPQQYFLIRWLQRLAYYLPNYFSLSIGAWAEYIFDIFYPSQFDVFTSAIFFSLNPKLFLLYWARITIQFYYYTIYFFAVDYAELMALICY